MGRRGVQQLTAEQWREALEQQMRDKEQQQREQRRQRFGGHEEEPQTRSQSAPQQLQDGELTPSAPGLERAATTALCVGETEGGHAAGRRRRLQQQQPPSREEYLKGLQDQIEEKKRLAQEQQEKEQSRHRRVSRSEDDAAAARRGGCASEEHQPEGKSGDAREVATMHMELQGTLEGVRHTMLSNQHEVEPSQAPMLSAGVAADPAAITKIVDFCEELKKQNEDVKRQLLEQHAVLTSLHSTLAVEVDGAAPVAASRRQNSALRDSVDKSQVKSGKLRASDEQAASIKKKQSKGSEAKLAAILPVAPRPRPMRGETKIPFPRKRLPSSLRTAGVDIVKGLSPGDATQQSSPLPRAEVKFDARVACSISIESKTAPPDSPHSRSAVEEHPQSKEIQSSFTDSRGCTPLKDAKTSVLESEEKEGHSSGSSPKKVGTKSCGGKNESSICHVVERTEGTTTLDDECPMDTESKLVHDWEHASANGDLLDCTSISILDGPSSLISLGRPLSDLFH